MFLLRAYVTITIKSSVCILYLSPVTTSGRVLFYSVSTSGYVGLSICPPRRSSLLQIMTEMFHSSSSIPPLHFRSWMVMDKGEDAKMLTSFFGHNSVTNGPNLLQVKTKMFQNSPLLPRYILEVKRPKEAKMSKSSSAITPLHNSPMYFK